MNTIQAIRHASTLSQVAQRTGQTRWCAFETLQQLEREGLAEVQHDRWIDSAYTSVATTRRLRAGGRMVVRQVIWGETTYWSEHGWVPSLDLATVYLRLGDVPYRLRTVEGLSVRRQAITYGRWRTTASPTAAKIRVVEL